MLTCNVMPFVASPEPFGLETRVAERPIPRERHKLRMAASLAAGVIAGPQQCRCPPALVLRMKVTHQTSTLVQVLETQLADGGQSIEGLKICDELVSLPLGPKRPIAEASKG